MVLDGESLLLVPRAAEVIAAAEGAGLPGTLKSELFASALELTRDAYELHMLYGIRAADQRALAAQGHLVRCLISYGEQWFPWYMRRLAERPANIWFVIKNIGG